MAKLQSSYLPPGLSPEDYARAMAAAQPSQPPVALPVQDEPAAAPPVSAASPEPAADQPDAAEQPPVAPVEMATGAPKQNIDTYRQQTLDAQNAQIANAPGLGDEHGLHGEDYRKMAAINEASAAKSAAVTKSARADVDESRKRQELMRSKADALFSEMERNKQPPPDSVMSKVLAAIGTVIAIGGNKPAAAQGVAMLAGTIGQDRERWAQEQTANSHLYQLALKGAESGSADDLNRLDAAAKVLALEGHEKLDALESAKNMGMGEHADAVATDMQLGLRAKITDSLTKIEEEKQKILEKRAVAAAKARVSGQRSAEEDALWRMPTPVLAQLRDAGGLSEMGHKVLAEKIKNEAGDAGAKKTAAEALKAQSEALGVDAGGTPGSDTPSGRRVENPRLYSQLSATEKKNITDSDTAARSLASNIDALLKLRADHGIAVGVPTTDAYRSAEAINSSIQLAIKEAKKLGTLDKGSVEFLENMTGNPNSWGDAPEQKLTAIKQATLRDADDLAKRAGLSVPERGARAKPIAFKPRGPGGAAPPQSAPSSPVEQAQQVARDYLANSGPGGGV